MSHHPEAGSAAGREPLVDALDPLVRAGTLRPDQATAALHAMTPVLTHVRPWCARERITAATVVLGAALALGGVTVALSAESGFAWKLFLASVAGIGVVAGAAVAVRVLLPSSAATEWTGGVLTALAVLATGALILRLGEDTTGIDYLAGLLMLALGAAGYWLLRHSALTLPVVAGALTMVTALLDDNVDTSEQSPGKVLLIGLVYAGVGVTIAAAGWWFDSRHVTAMLGGSIAVLAVLVTITTLGTVSAVVGFGGAQGRGDDATDDIWLAMAVGLLVCAGLAGLHARTQFPGYAVLVVVGVTLLPVTAVTAVSSDHPARWGAALAVAALVVVAASLAPTLLARRRLASDSSR